MKARRKFISAGHATSIYALCPGVIPGTIISGSGDKHIAQWNVKDGTQDKFSARFPSPVFSLLHLKSFSQLWVGTANGHIHVLDTDKKQEIHAFAFHSAQVFDISFSAADNAVFTCAGDGTVAVFDPHKLCNLHFRKFSENKIRSLDFYDDLILLAEGSGKTILIQSDQFQPLRSFQTDKFATNCYYVDKSNRRLVSGGRDAHLRMWDLAVDFQPLMDFPAHHFAIYKILYAENHHFFITASRDKSIKIWSDNFAPLLKITKESHHSHAYSVNTLCWMEEENILVSAGDDRLLMGWELLLD